MQTRKYRTDYDAIGATKATLGVIEVTPEVAAAMGLGEPIDVPPPVKTAAQQQDEAIALFLSQKAEDVIPQIAAVSSEKADQLKALREAEAKDKKRKTVLDAIDAQLKTFEPKE